ncbi:MAG: class I SAM-dependent methyltransferase [Acidimicrobiales bacterium]
MSDPQLRWGRAVLDRLSLDGGETVLDAGCGSGRVTEVLLDRLPRGRVIALDASPSMLERAANRLSDRSDRVRFLEADLLDLDPAMLGPDHPVDAVFSTATFHWVLDHDRLFANLAAVLRPGGQLVAQCGAQGNLDGLLESARSLGVKRAGTWMYASVPDTESRLRAAGFPDAQVWTNPEPTPFPDRSTIADFLETVCLREHLATLPEEERRPLVVRVAEAMPEPVIDYVRLNIVARVVPTSS